MREVIIAKFIISDNYFIFSSDKEQIGAKRRKKIPHFSDYLGGGGGGGGGPGMGGAGGGGGGFNFGAFGFLAPTIGFLPNYTNSGTSQSGNQGEQFTYCCLLSCLMEPIDFIVPSICLVTYHRSQSLFGRET